jgi:TonB family protein
MRKAFVILATIVLLAGMARAQDAARDNVTLPVPVTEVRPAYTSAALERRIEGIVQVAVLVREDGSVGDATITQSLDAEYGLDTNALEAAKQWRFKPGLRDGKPAEVTVTLEMRFTLK